MTPNLRLFPLGVDLLNDLVEVRALVHVLPERLAVSRVVSPRVILLCPIVDEGNTTCGERKHGGVAQLGLFSTKVVQEARVIMIVNKHPQGIEVLEVPRLGIVAILYLSHVLTFTENILNRVVHRIVEEPSQVLLVGAHVGWISVEALTHLKNARVSTILLPEVLRHLGDRIDTNSVEVVRFYEVFHPVFQVAAHVAVVLVKVGQSRQSAVLNGILVVPVNVTVCVVVIALVEGIDFREVVADGSHMVSNHIHHDPDSFGVGGRH